MSSVVTTRAMIEGQYVGRRSGELAYVIDGERVDGRRFATRIFKQLQDSPGPRRIVCLVHGFNVRHDEALAWQQRVETVLLSRLTGTTVCVLYSWPSDGLASRYLDDRSEARHAGVHLADLIHLAWGEIQRRHCDVQLCLLGHSMGSYVIARAASAAAESLGYPLSAPLFSEIVWLSPDLDAEALQPGRNAERVPVFTRRLTVYYTRRDGALAAASAKRLGATGARLGRSGPEGELPSNVVAIDCTNLVDSHSGYWHSEPALKDIAGVLSSIDRCELRRDELDETTGFELCATDGGLGFERPPK